MRATVAGLISALALVLVATSAPARAQESPLQLRLLLERSAYEPGVPIRFTLQLRNVSSQPVTVSYASAQHFDVALMSNAVVVDRWSRTQTFAQIQNQQQLAPGQVQTFVGSWLPTSDQLPTAAPVAVPQPIPSGVFQVVAVLTSVTWPISSRPEPIIIGTPTLLPSGCSDLPFLFTAELPVEVVARAIDPSAALISLWQRSIAFGIYTGFQLQSPAANDLRVVNRVYPLTICLNIGARVILP